MQDKYVGDVRDFDKFQLFRCFFNYPESPFDGKRLAQILSNEVFSFLSKTEYDCINTL